MKNKLLTLIALLFSLTLILCSCKIGGDDSGDGGSSDSGSGDSGSGDTGSGDSGGDTGSDDSDSSVVPSGKVFAESGTQIYLIAEDALRENLNDDSFGGVLYNVTGNRLMGDSPDAAPHTHELIVGECDRELSKKAYRALSRLDYNTPEYAGYAIYSDGNSIAVAYSNDLALDYVLDLLTEDFLTPTEGKIYIGTGTLTRDSFGLYKHLLAEDEKDRAAEVAAFREAMGDDAETDALISALEAIYSIYTPDMVMWIANLYDPVIGGFYYSNSGRDTDGFLPDIESTYQAMNFLANSGVISRAELPAWLVEDILSFVKSLQNPYDGFFYHPQWLESGVNDARRGRDLNWAERFFADFGEEPLYPTANDRLRGEVFIPDDFDLPTPVASPLGGRGSGSAAVLASKVVATALPSHLTSPEAFLSYLNSFDWSPGNSYEHGNHIAAQASQIKAAGLMPVCLEFFDSIINPETGMWSDTLNNEAVNGHLKIGSLYVGSGHPIPYALTAAKGILVNNLRMYAGDLKGRSREYYASTPCHLYNPWAAICNILSNLNGCDAESKKVAQEIISLVKAEAPEQIRQTMSLALEFRKLDGSFSWQYNMNSSGSQGAAVAVAGINEGDVNSTSLSSSSVLSYIFQSMGASKYTFKMFGDAEKLLFLDTMENLGEIVKTGATSKGVKNFEEGNAETNLDETWRVELDTEISALEQTGWGYGYVTDEGALALGRVTSGDNCYVGVFPAGKSTNTRNVMEFDLRYGDFKIWKGQTKGNVVRLSMYGGGGRFYSIYLYYNANGNLSLSENQSIELEKGEWNTVRLEYYRDTMLNFCKVYINGNYVGEYGTSDESFSDLSWTKGLIEIDGSVESCHLEIDNIYMGRDDEKHETELIEGWQPENRPTVTEGDKAGGLGEYYNSDAPGKRYDYDNGESKPAQDGGNKNVIVELIESDYVLWYKQAINNESYLTYNFDPASQPEESKAENSVGIVELDFKLGNVNTPIPVRLGVWCGGIEAEIRILMVNGTLRFGNKSGQHFKGSPRLNPDEWYNLRFEFYYKESSLTSAKIKVYVDNEYMVDINVTNINNRAEKSDRVNIYLHKLEEAAYMCLDNLYLGYTTGTYEYVAPPAELPEPPMPEFDGDVTDGFYESGEEGKRLDGTEAPPAINVWPLDRAPSAAISNTDGILVYEKLNADYEEYITLTFPDAEAYPNVVSIFEFDFSLDNVTSNVPARFELYAGGKSLPIHIGYNASGDYLYFSTNTGAERSGSPHLETGRVYKIRLENYYYLNTDGTAEIKVYIDNEYSFDIVSGGLTSRTQSPRVNVYLSKAEAGSVMTLDNIFMGYINKSYVEPTIPEADENNGKGSYFTGEEEAVKGENKNFNGGSGITSTAYASGASGQYIGYYYKMSNSESATNNSYVYISYPTLGEALTYATSIFEADVCFDGIGAVSKFGKITLCNSGKEIEVTLWIEDGKIYFGNAAKTPLEGLPYLEAGKWYNIRITAHYYQFTAGAVNNVGVYVSVNGSEDVEIKGANCLDRQSKNWTDRAFIYLFGEQPEASLSIDNLFLGYARVNPEQCSHKDADFDAVCDICGTTYYTEATCPGHVDENSDTKCDVCDTTYYTEATCPGHKDDNADTKCDYCGTTYYTAATCPGHVDEDSNTKCDVCDTTYYTEDTCPGHVDNSGDGRCDYCDKVIGEPTLPTPSENVTDDFFGKDGNADEDGWL